MHHSSLMDKVKLHGDSSCIFRLLLASATFWMFTFQGPALTEIYGEFLLDHSKGECKNVIKFEPGALSSLIPLTVLHSSRGTNQKKGWGGGKEGRGKAHLSSGLVKTDNR